MLRHALAIVATFTALSTSASASVTIPNMDKLRMLDLQAPKASVPAQEPEAAPVSALTQCFRDHSSKMFEVADIESAQYDAASSTLTLETNDLTLHSNHVIKIILNGEEPLMSLKSTGGHDGVNQDIGPIERMNKFLSKGEEGGLIDFSPSETVQAARACVGAPS